MANLEMKISISDLEPVKLLLEALNSNYESLPDEVKNALNTVFHAKPVVWDCDFFSSMGISPADVDVLADGVSVRDVVEIYPESFEMLIARKGKKKFSTLIAKYKPNGETICEVLQ